MFDLDVRTAFLIIGLLYLLLPAITWTVLAEQRSRQVLMWCGGGLLIGGSLILTGVRELFPTWVYLMLSNLMFLTAHFARIQSLRLDLGIPWRMRWMVLAASALSLTYAGIHFVLHDNSMRAAFSAIVTVGFLIHLTWLAKRIGHKEHSTSANWIAGVYGLVAFAMFYRVLSVLGNSDSGSLLISGFSQILLTLSILLSAVVGHFGYVGLALDRSIHRELEAAANRARDEERHRLSAQIAQLDRQRSLGELSASLGHELNQPLAAILTNVQVTKRGLQSGHIDTTQAFEFLDKIATSTQRASQIIERIRDFIRPSAARLEPVNLHLMVLEVTELVADEARQRNVYFVFPTNPSPIQVMGDPIQLSQIVLNVLRNAIEALTQTTRREIQVSITRSGERAILKIRDTGKGLTPEVITQIGAPFFTTKATGLGMGISISRTIAAQHGGILTFSNAAISEGGGTIVELDLPIMSAAQS